MSFTSSRDGRINYGEETEKEWRRMLTHMWLLILMEAQEKSFFS